MPTHPGPLSTHCEFDDPIGSDRQEGSKVGKIAVVDRAGADERRGCETKLVVAAANWDQTCAALLHDPLRVLRLAPSREPGMTGPERRMTGKGQFAVKGEDADPVIGAGLGRRLEEGGFRIAEPARDALHFIGLERVAIGNHRQGIAGKGPCPEDIGQASTSRIGRAPPSILGRPASGRRSVKRDDDVPEHAGQLAAEVDEGGNRGDRDETRDQRIFDRVRTALVTP